MIAYENIYCKYLNVEILSRTDRKERSNMANNIFANNFSKALNEVRSESLCEQIFFNYFIEKWQEQYDLIDLSKFKIMIDAGLQLQNTSKDTILLLIDKKDIAFYLIDEMGFDIDILRKYIVEQTFYLDSILDPSEDIFRKIYPNLSTIDDRLIGRCGSNVQFAEILLSYGIDIELVVDCATKYVMGNYYGNIIINHMMANNLVIHSNVDKYNKIICQALDDGSLSLAQIRYMIEAGMNNDIDTILISACKFCDINVIKYLVNDCSANINAKSSTVLSMAFDHDNKLVAKFLLDNNIEITKEVYTSAVKNIDNIKLLINYGIDPLILSYNCIIGLHDYNTKQHRVNIFKTIEFLLDSEVDLNEIFRQFIKNQK